MAKRSQNDQQGQPGAGGGSEPARKSREFVLNSGGKKGADRKTAAAGSSAKHAVAPGAKSSVTTPPGDPGSSKGRLIRDLKVGLAIALLVGAIYATYSESNTGRLFFDDHSAIENNTNVRAFVNPTTRWKFKTWLRACSSDVETPLSGRPVASLSFALNHWWASAMHPSLKADYDGLLPAHAPYFHYVNLAIHMLVATLLFLLVRRTMTAPNFGDAHLATADLWGFFVALAWALHPLNTEAVVYVTQRTEQLVSLFLLLTLYCSARSFDAATSTGRDLWTLAAVAACLLGMGSKENMIAAPLLVVAYDRAFNYPDWRSALKARWWFYTLIAATWVALGFILVTNPRGLTVGFHDARLPWYEYLITQCWCLWRYFWLTIVPLGGKLCVDYGRRPVLDFHHTAPGALLVFSLLGVTIWGWLRKPWVGFLGVWFFFILAPTSSFYPIITEVGAERRMYLPSAAILIGLIVGVVALVGRMRSGAESGDGAASAGAGPFQPAGRTNRFMRVALVVALVPIAWLGYTSHQRNRIYQDDLTLYKHIVDVFPDNDRGCNNYGSACMSRGLIDEALGLFNRAIKIDPEYTDALTNRGLVFLGQDWNPGSAHTDLSIADANEALNWQWFGTIALNNRATAYMNAKQYDRAQSDFEQLLKINPLSADAKYNQALFLSKRGDDDPKYLAEALTVIDEALRISPDSYRAYNARGDILNKLKRYDEAIAAFRKALEAINIDAKQWPPESDVYQSWKAADAGLNQVTAANRTVDPKLQQAASKFPNRTVMAAVYGNLGVCYERAAATKSDPQDYLNRAVGALSKAAFLDGGDPRYYTLRGSIFLNANRFGEALYDFDAVLQRHRYFPEALFGRVKTYAKTGNFAAARADALTLQRLHVPLDAEKSALIADVLAKSATP